MLTFHHTMDPHSLDIKREGKGIGYINWHKGESVARVHIWHESHSNDLYVSEMEQIVELRKNNFKL